MTPLDHALRLAEHGLPVFPVAKNKAPTCPHGMNDATRDAKEVRALWRNHPGPLVGVQTGTGSGLDCLDLDTTRHSEADAWHSNNSDRLRVTRTHRTRSGGLHLLYRHMPGLRCSTSKIARGVDVKGDAGCFVWWPAAGFPVPVRSPVAAWPTWLAELLIDLPVPSYDAAKRPPPPANAGHRGRYVDAAIRSAIQIVATAPEGQRNSTLNAETYKLARFIQSGDLTADNIAIAMTSGARAAGLPVSETIRTVASALRAVSVR